MSELIDYLIIGGGVAGGHAIFEIRRRDKAGRIVVINEEDHFPYDRPPLSKEYLAGKKRRREVFYRADSYYARNKVEVVKEQVAQSIDTSSRSVTLDGGREFSYKTLLIATGGRVNRLDELPGSQLKGIYYLRTIDDCDAIRRAVASGPKKSKQVAIVGGGFIGCEVAATLRSKGSRITLLNKSSHLLSRAIDEETSSWIQGYQSKKGVDVLTGANVSEFVGKGGDVNEVRLEGGKSIPADLVVVGVGITPNTELAEKAGLHVDDGIVVDEHLETRAKGVFVAGDAARFHSPVFKRDLRLEHVDVAQKQGGAAGMNMVAAVKKRRKMMKPFDELPYFFSYQFDLDMNAYGDLSSHTQTVLRGKMDTKTGFIQFYLHGATLDGILAVNADWNEIEAAKSLILTRKALADTSILADESRTLRSIIRKGLV